MKTKKSAKDVGAKLRLVKGIDVADGVIPWERLTDEQKEHVRQHHAARSDLDFVNKVRDDIGAMVNAAYSGLNDLPDLRRDETRARVDAAAYRALHHLWIMSSSLTKRIDRLRERGYGLDFYILPTSEFRQFGVPEVE